MVFFIHRLNGASLLGELNDGKLMGHGPRGGGLRTFAKRTTNGVVVGYGDFLARQNDPDALEDIDDVLLWARSGFHRVGGCLVRKGEAFLFTDGMGLCPIHYAVDASGGLFFSDSAREIALKLGGVQLRTFDGFRPVPKAPETVFHGVNRVPRGTILQFRHNGGGWKLVSSRSYHHLPVHWWIEDQVQASSLLLAALRCSVAKALDSSRELSIALSGGVDSSTIAYLACEMGAQISSFTVGSRFGDEFDQARWTANEIQSNHQELTLDEDDLEEIVPDLIRSFELWDPLTLQIAAPAELIFRTARDKYPLFLTGYGSDLIFGGVLPSNPRPDKLHEQIREQIEATVTTNEFSSSLASRHGIIVRHPFWSEEVLTCGLGIDAALKMRNGTEKWILRRAVTAVVPPVIANRRKLGIHEGSQMHKLFSNWLQADDLGSQAEALRSRATAILS